jgi:hypothetical protein
MMPCGFGDVRVRLLVGFPEIVTICSSMNRVFFMAAGFFSRGRDSRTAVDPNHQADNP